ncbi:MAG: MaoC family dehydratase [Hyphomicrobiaceae bacterium]
MHEGKAGGAILYHEDIEVGTPLMLGSTTVTKDAIVAFARAYDPQPIHLDEEAAKTSIVGGLCASGYHTCAIMMRMLVHGFLGRAASQGSPGVDEVRWLKPVRPGEAVRTRFTPLEKRVLGSRPDVGITKVLVELIDGQDQVLASWLTNQLTRLRTPGPAPAQTSAAKAARNPLASLWDDATVVAQAYPDLPFEDRQIGETTDIGSHTFSRDDIVGFASQFDPQPFHLDEAAAKASLFGGLCASGWQTAAFLIRGIITARQQASAAARAQGVELATYGPSPGFRNLRWLKPVFVGDTIEYRTRLADKVDLKSRPERGLLVSEAQGRNQRGDVVFAITTQMLAERRRR